MPLSAKTETCSSPPWESAGITPAELAAAASKKPIRNHGTSRTTRPRRFSTRSRERLR
jgi:hypothetical protein